MCNELWTIGYGNRTMTEFRNTLKEYGINALVDIRRVPYSSYCPAFNRESVASAVKQDGIAYIPMGFELGLPKGDKELYNIGNHLDRSKVQKTPQFISGISRLMQGLEKGYRIALMCCEKDPSRCHRFVFISPYLERKGVTVNHIIDEFNVITQNELEKRMVTKFFPQADDEYQQGILFPEEMPYDVFAEKMYYKIACGFS